MGTVVTMNMTVKVDNTDNEIECIQTNTLRLEQSSTMRVKQEDDDSDSLVIDLLDSSKDNICGN
jgi:hypothetical protein